MLGVLCGMAAMRWMAPRRELDRFHVPGRWRLIAALVLLLVIPFISPYIGMWSLQAFLKVYVIPLAVLLLVYLSASRLRAGRAPTRPIALGRPDSKPDSLKEATP
jgi:ABC-type maltose transport system permease subunit